VTSSPGLDDRNAASMEVGNTPYGKGPSDRASDRALIYSVSEGKYAKPVSAPSRVHARVHFQNLISASEPAGFAA